MRSQLRVAFGKLDAKQAELFVYKYLDGMTHDEIALVLGTSRKTVQKRLDRLEAALAPLRKELGDE